MDTHLMPPDTDGVLTVSQLNRRVGDLLSSHFSRIWVRGEVSNFTQAASGHWYFSVKDEGAAVRAVMFRGRAQAVGFVPKPGDRKSVVSGKGVAVRVDLGGRRIIKKKTN